MVTLPPEFAATKYPGYFLNMNTMVIYSLKIDGVLKPIKYTKGNSFNHYRSGYRVSHHGSRRWLDNDYLHKLKQSNSVIPVADGR